MDKKQRPTDAEIASAIRSCIEALNKHFDQPLEGRGPYTAHTLSGPVKCPGGPCLCRWCKLGRIVKMLEEKE